MITGIPEICFLLVGEGSEKKRLEKRVKDQKLQNIVFKGFVSKDDYPILAKEADIGLVNLNNKNKTPVMPGKILGFMAASLPIVAFLHKESDGHKLIKKAQCGYSMVPNHLEDAVKLIRRVYHERNNLETSGKNGYSYTLKHFSKEICIPKLERLIH